MKNKHTAGIVLLLFTAVEFGAFLLWGLNMHEGDAMGYGLIVVYFIMPLTALILSAVLSTKKSIFLIPVGILKILSHIFLPFLVFGTFEITLSLALSAIPCLVGAITGFAINKFKTR